MCSFGSKYFSFIHRDPVCLPLLSLSLGRVYRTEISGVRSNPRCERDPRHWASHSPSLGNS